MISDSWACRSCGSTQCSRVVDLGMQPLANGLLDPASNLSGEHLHALVVLVCNDCWLVQLGETVDPAELFSHYVYFSSFSATMVEHAHAAVHRYIRDYGLDHASFVVEIASNDGYLLEEFVASHVPCLGVDPAANVAEAAIHKGVDTKVAFFGAATASEIVAEHGRAQLILANNVFAHAPDMNDFLAGVSTLLAPFGTAVFEFPYLGDLLDTCAFDTMYHEHVFYLSVSAIEPALQRHDLQLIGVERLDIHGGSLRIFFGHEDSPPRHQPGGADELRASEATRGLRTMAPYEDFGERVQGVRSSLRHLLGQLRSDGNHIAAYGASAKGSTLLNYCGIGADFIDFVVDRSTVKQGLLTPGTHLPILPVEELLTRRPAYTLLLTWNFAEEILAQQQAYREAGGKFVLPVPTATIV